MTHQEPSTNAPAEKSLISDQSNYPSQTCPEPDNILGAVTVPPSVGQACNHDGAAPWGQRSDATDLIKEISSDDKVIGCY